MIYATYAVVPPLAILQANFKQLAIDIRSFREPLKRSIQGVIAPSIGVNFAVGGRPAWADLEEDTVRAKASEGIANPSLPLTRKGKLKKVAQQLNAWTITKDNAFMNRLPGADYGWYHVTGTRFMPERDFAIIQPEDIDEIEEVFRIWLYQRMARSGF